MAVLSGASSAHGAHGAASGVPDGTTSVDGTLVLESCHSTWLFDTARSRFRRVLKDPELENPGTSTSWRPYFGLELDPESESFVVLLNPTGTRLIRSWRHVEHCAQCGGETTAELSLDELRAAILRAG